MARLAQPVSPDTVKVYRGVVDFYFWKGIPVARAWPRKKRNQPSQAEQATRENFAVIAKATGGIGSTLQGIFADFAAGAEGYSWVDAYRAFSSGAGWVSDD